MTPDPYAFQAEFTRLTAQLGDSKLIEQRLLDEINRGNEQAARRMKVNAVRGGETEGAAEIAWG